MKKVNANISLPMTPIITNHVADPQTGNSRVASFIANIAAGASPIVVLAAIDNKRVALLQAKVLNNSDADAAVISFHSHRNESDDIGNVADESVSDLLNGEDITIAPGGGIPLDSFVAADNIYPFIHTRTGEGLAIKSTGSNVTIYGQIAYTE